MIFKAPPQLGQRATSISNTRLSSRAQLMRAFLTLGRDVIGRGLGGTLCWSGNEFTAQLGVGCQHAMGAFASC